MYSRGYDGCRSLYPATSRLQSVPPRFYDVVDRDGDVVCSDMMYRGRARSVARNTQLHDGWNHPMYNDMVVGSTASPGHFFPRSSTEFCRDILSRSRSPSPAPEHINHYHRDMIAEHEEKIHHSYMKLRYPETFRGSSSVYNPLLGRCYVSHDSPGYRYYRYSSPPPPESNVRFRTRLSEPISVPTPPDNLIKYKRKKESLPGKVFH